MLEKASAADNNQLSKEDYLIMRAKDALPVDIYAAKSWLITAKSLFPHSAKVQVSVNVYRLVFVIFCDKHFINALSVTNCVICVTV